MQQADAWAAARGLTLDDSLALVDPGRSASKGHHLKEGAALHRFLAAAKAGDLGASPVLLIEDFTRLSRLEPLDSLDQIVSPLVRAGVEIVTLEDGASYTLERLNRDPSCLVVLVVKSQAAADYARKLSGYITQRRAANRADILNGKPVCIGWAPSWIEWNEKGQRWQFTPYVATVRRLVELSWEHGQQVTCRTLNTEGHLSPAGLPWSQRTVAAVLQSAAIHGARRVSAPGHADEVKAWRAECARLTEQNRTGADLPPKPKRTYSEAADTFPAILTAEEHAALLATMKARVASPQEKGRRDRVHFIGQGITTCTCGGPIGARSVKPRRRSGVKGEQRYVYLICRARERGQTGCSVPPIRVEPVHAALLTRLRGDALAQLVDGGGDGHLAALLARQGQLTYELAQVESRAANAAAALRDRAMAGAAAVAVYEQAVEEAAAAVVATKEALAGVAAEIRAIQTQPSAGAAAEQVQGMLQDFAAGDDTPEQRRTINTLLRRLGVQILLDAKGQRMALVVGDGEPDWQPLVPGMALQNLQRGQADTDYARPQVESMEQLLAKVAEAVASGGSAWVELPGGGRVEIGPDGQVTAR